MKQSRFARLQPYLFMLPAILILLFIYAAPMLASIFLSFTDWNGISREFNMVGFSNYARVFTNSALVAPLKNTLIFTVVTVIFQCSLGLLLALALNRSFRGRDALRAIFFLPCVVSMVAIGYAWSLIYNPVTGPLKKIADSMGWEWLSSIKWLSNPKLVLYSICIVNIWQWTGWSMVIYIAGLQAIPDNLYEAAAIDGAGAFQRFWNVTVPQILPSVTINVVMTTIGGLKAYDLMYVMTGGGPGHASQTFGMLVVDTLFNQNKAGLGSALSMVMFAMVLIVSVLQNTLLSSKEES